MTTDEARESRPEAAETTGDDPEPATLAEAVENMLAALPYTPKHDALVRLARHYAVAIDQGDVDTLAKVGPRLESVCVRLGVKPVSASGGEQGGRTSVLAEWRSRRAN